MPSNVESFGYQGPSGEWKPHIGGLDTAAPTSVGQQSSGGYHDLGYLQALLDDIILNTNNMYKSCEEIMSEFSLAIDTTDELFVSAHNQVYPVDDTPGYVTFDEYKYLLEHNNSNAAQYIITSYETKVRGSSGTNALDISLLSLYINSECKRIKEFINDYIGEVDDSSEYRTIEIFQDWAEDTKVIITELWKALKGQVQRSIPKSELDRLTEVKSGEFQALFQVKLNTINKNVINQFNQLVKNWDHPAKTFYNKNLGPALKFRLKVGRSISEGIRAEQFPILSAEASGTTTGLDSNLEVTLADCVKRNQMFFDLVIKILTNLGQRDSYIKYINQLSQKGKSVNKPFVKSDSITQADEIVEARVLDADRSLSATATSFGNYHADLSGLLDDDAHTQYVLRSGSEQYPVTGDILVADGITIDGVDISEHDHDGINSKKIHGANIEYGTLTSENLDLSTTATATPSNLTIETVQSSFLSPGNSKVEVTVSFDVDTSAISGYEFEIIRLD